MERGTCMQVFQEYLDKIDNPVHRGRTQKVLDWVIQQFPRLTPRMAWNQPMFTDHGTFIIGFSISKHHLAVSPEQAGMIYFYDEIIKSGYEQSKMLFRIKWDDPVDFSLLTRMIAYNISDKAECKTFWRK